MNCYKFFFQDNKAIGEKYGIHPRDVESKKNTLKLKKAMDLGREPLRKGSAPYGRPPCTN